MFLSRLEVFGFKSFAQRVQLKFDSGLTAIVGPNGCHSLGIGRTKNQRAALRQNGKCHL